MLIFTAICILAWLLFSSAASLQCYTGFMPWDADESTRNSSVKLENCRQDGGCCLLVASIPGKLFKCTANCPQSYDDYPQCGKELDSSWCYCRDHKDSNCAPLTEHETQVEENAIEGNEINNDDDMTEISEHNVDKHPGNDGLQCYVGFESWNGLMDNVTTAPITLQSCAKEHSCCRIVNSLPGSIYSCSSGCPKDWSKACGPHPEEEIMDVGWCYCKDHHDPNCAPSSTLDTKSTAPLKCYTGFVPWGQVADSNSSVTLKDCQRGEGCCLLINSLLGRTFKCIASCPPSDNYPQCDEEVDSSWCFCKDHEDSNCAPSQKNEVQLNESVIEGNEINDDEDMIEISDYNVDNNAGNDGLQCYVGFESWPGQADNKATALLSAQNCSEEYTCCHVIRTLFGSVYSCSSDCPEDWSKACGPQPADVIKDIGWCYCKDRHDYNCAPYRSNITEGSLPDDFKEANDKNAFNSAFKAVVGIVNFLFPKKVSE